jgi:hypothetical protein
LAISLSANKNRSPVSHQKDGDETNHETNLGGKAMDSTTQTRSASEDRSFDDGTKLPGTLPVEDRSFDDGTKLPGTLPVEDRSFDDGTKLPGTLPVQG